MEGRGERRIMFGHPCYFINGNMFIGVFGDKVFLRLPQEGRDRIMKDHSEIAPFSPREGMSMKEYVTIPHPTQCDIEWFERWRDRSIDYASKLPPRKKTSRGKA
jgi:TfoX/Sxy family transcriptional regulator of competence genes